EQTQEQTLEQQAPEQTQEQTQEQTLEQQAPEQTQEQNVQDNQKQTICTVANLTLARNKRELFAGLSFSIQAGQVLGIVGPSGIGKSSVGDALCGLLKAKSGSITWHLPERKVPQILKLYQDPISSFAPNVKLAILLQDVINRHQLNASLIPELLKVLQLKEELLERTANQVSGGELQRLAILRVLLFEPKVIFADEITSRLDPLTQREILDFLIRSCKQRNCAVIIVSHEQGLIDYYCQEVVNLQNYVTA
ncbi:ABC transporter ATP-binding protein, partial [Psittacicella hinzii]